MGVGLGVVLHLVMSALIDLSPDEAHYALYASHLDWSYYDHPPMVGWLQWVLLQASSGNVAMRVVPMLAWVLTAWGVVRVGDALYPQLAASSVWGVRVDLLLLLLSPIPHLLGVALTPDTLLMPLTCWVMWLTWRVCEDTANVHSLRTWFLLGVALGLSGLTKYTAVLLAFGVVLALCQAYGWRWLLLRGPWLALAIAVLCVVPVLYWNAIHDWASFVYQTKHAAGGNAWHARKLLLYVVVVVIAYGLIVPWALRVAGPSKKSALFVAAFATPGLLLLFYLSGRGSTLPHWAAPFFVAVLPMAASGVQTLLVRYARRMQVLLVLQASLCVAMFTLMCAGGIPTENDTQALTPPGIGTDKVSRNPFADLHGWSQAADHAVQWAQEKNTTTLAVTNWTLASRIAWYARPMPVKVVNTHGDQFDIWFGRLAAHEDAIWIDWSLMGFAPPVGASQFSRCDVLENLPVLVWERQLAHFNISHCQDWQGATP